MNLKIWKARFEIDSSVEYEAILSEQNLTLATVQYHTLATGDASCNVREICNRHPTDIQILQQTQKSDEQQV